MGVDAGSVAPAVADRLGVEPGLCPAGTEQAELARRKEKAIAKATRGVFMVAVSHAETAGFEATPPIVVVAGAVNVGFCGVILPNIRLPISDCTNTGHTSSTIFAGKCWNRVPTRTEDSVRAGACAACIMCGPKSSVLADTPARLAGGGCIYALIEDARISTRGNRQERRSISVSRHPLPETRMKDPLRGPGAIRKI